MEGNRQRERDIKRNKDREERVIHRETKIEIKRHKDR